MLPGKRSGALFLCSLLSTDGSEHYHRDLPRGSDLTVQAASTTPLLFPCYQQVWHCDVLSSNATTGSAPHTHPRHPHMHPHMHPSHTHAPSSHTHVPSGHNRKRTPLAGAAKGVGRAVQQGRLQRRGRWRVSGRRRGGNEAEEEAGGEAGGEAGNKAGGEDQVTTVSCDGLGNDLTDELGDELGDEPIVDVDVRTSTSDGAPGKPRWHATWRYLQTKRWCAGRSRTRATR